MLLAAGRGERMEPLSSFVPKPALDVLGEPLAASAWRHLAPHCQRVVANLHRHADAVATALARLAAAERRTIAFSREPVLLGGAGGVAAARPLFADGPVLVGNTDVWACLDLEPLLARTAEDVGVLAVIPHPDPQRWSAVKLAADGRVERFVHRWTGGGEAYLFTGFQLLGAQVVASLSPPPGEFASLWEGLRARGALRAVVVTGSWMEAGTPTAYLDLVLRLLGKARWCHDAARVAGDAQLLRSAVGEGCRVGPGTELTDCVIAARAAVGADCRLRRCIVAGPVAVPARARLEHVLVLPTGVTPLE